MRPLRFLITVLTFILASFLLLFSGPWRSSSTQTQDRANVGTYFNWRTPSSLFPPSAIISLTDDNSTNFLARPAAFGPLLPVKSLSGQLWVGGGFGDDHLGRGEGELGCSDVPGWDDGSWYSGNGGTKKTPNDGKSTASDTSSTGSSKTKSKRSSTKDELEDDKATVQHLSGDDGTDDYLHHPLQASDGLKTNGEAAGTAKKPTHADIQSLQESAEIAGKIVLLSRGGCGFLEKVKWVQRRGGIALIVGDDIRGGPLVTMYARGDTSNVTIPSLFTSHTTAQLLSSLMPSGTLAEEGNGLDLGQGKGASEGSGSRKNADDADKPNFTTENTSKATPASKTKQKEKNTKSGSKQAEKPKHRGWFAFLFGDSALGADSRRPPSSGNIGWVLQEEFDDEPIGAKTTKSVSSTTSTAPTATVTSRKGDSDGFQIGVQDWRDPDLVAEQKEQNLRGTASISSSSTTANNKHATTSAALKGGSITPGSGEYGKANHEAVDIGNLKKQSKGSMTSQQSSDQQGASRGWLARLFSSDPPTDDDAKSTRASKANAGKAPSPQSQRATTENFRRPLKTVGRPEMHEGLWVTLSPTSMSSSPFFDTLLVLVVSPLVTLTVVYALLLLRSRIRRRRWRAPKSVVERLPVRTYQTMPSAAPSSTTSSISSPITATTPLLPASRPISTRSRPRARTTSEVPQGSSMRSDEMASPSLEQIEEKRAAGLAEWRRRYGGKQRECVVCLEEYVDGVSRVMSLPCGHEFHAECITPWLTTRRRTCPICKGDVVRSLARSAGSSSTSPPQQQYRDHDGEDEVDVQEQVINTVNDDPAAQQPVSREDEAFEDLERGVSPTPDRTR